MKIRGFTLAEVLITLGVIGVVAAITVPVIMNNYKKQATVSKLKKVYSILNQAVKLSEIDNGLPSTWGADSQYEYFDRYWQPYIKINKKCSNIHGRCGYSHVPWRCRNGQCIVYFDYGNSLGVGAMLIDGIFAYFTTNQVNVDINGLSGPNRFGKDVFRFEISDLGIVPLGINEQYSVINNDCKVNGECSYCMAKIVKDGWQIKDDYPW